MPRALFQSLPEGNRLLRMTACAGWPSRVQALWSTPSGRVVRELAAWSFGVIAPIACFGLAFGMGMFRRWGVLVYGYAACSIVAFVASRFLRSGRRPAFDSLVAGALVGAFLFSLALVFYFGLRGVFQASLSLLFAGSLRVLALSVLGLAALPSSFAYGLAARRSLMSAYRTAPGIVGFFAPPLLLFTAQCVVWREVDERTAQLVAAIDAGVPVEEIDTSGLRNLRLLSDWPGLMAEIQGGHVPETERDRRIAELHGRLMRPGPWLLRLLGARDPKPVPIVTRPKPR
jgi:hypothetical protein